MTVIGLSVLLCSLYSTLLPSPPLPCVRVFGPLLSPTALLCYALHSLRPTLPVFSVATSQGLQDMATSLRDHMGALAQPSDGSKLQQLLILSMLKHFILSLCAACCVGVAGDRRLAVLGMTASSIVSGITSPMYRHARQAAG